MVINSRCWYSQVTVHGVDVTSNSKVYFDFKISINEVIELKEIIYMKVFISLLIAIPMFTVVMFVIGR